MEEGSFPTADDSIETRLSKLWFRLDGVLAQVKGAYDQLKGRMETGTELDWPSSDHGSSSNNIRIDFGGATLLVVCVLVTIIGACGVVMGIDIAERSAQEREAARNTAALAEKMQDLQRQYRMTELKLDDWTVVAHRSGLVLPGDYTRGPQGNLDSDSFKPQR